MIVMACPGVGKVRRGFERMFEDLFALLEDDEDVVLYKGGGERRPCEVVLPFIHRNSEFLRRVPLHRLVGRTAIHVECFTFALALLWALRGKQVDMIHVVDPPLARFLYKLRDRFGLKFRLLYSEGCAMPPSDYPPCDHIPQISQASYDEAIAAGIPAGFMTLVPLGIYPERFAATGSREALREKWKIPPDAFVICVISALNRNHKRIDYIVDECAQLSEPFLLWIDGSLDQGDPEVIDYAKERLGDRVRVTHVESRDVRDIYGCADIQVHGSTFEAFGLAMIEGPSTGLPLLTHDGPHYRWLTDNAACNIDMREPGKLRDRLCELMASPDRLEELSIRDRVMPRFSWRHLKSDYHDLFARVLSLPDEEVGIAHRYGLR
jgi:glycosyltransferase involved in cell wall biosynthesis